MAKGAPKRFGKRNKEKVRGWIWNSKKKYWKKGKKIYKPKKKKTAPKSIDLAKKAKLLRTRKTGVPIAATAFINNDALYQEREILKSYLSLAGVELFQYTNSRTINGMFDDVSIISVLSSRRKEYSANDIIDIYPAFIRTIYRGTGNDSNKLYVELDGSYNGGTLELEFWVKIPAVDNLWVIGSNDYV